MAIRCRRPKTGYALFVASSAAPSADASSFVVKLGLWLLFIVPGLIYSMALSSASQRLSEVRS